MENVQDPFQEGESGGALQGPTEAMRAEVWRKSNTVKVRINPTYPDSHHVEQYSSDMLDMSYDSLAITDRRMAGLRPSYDPSHHAQEDSWSDRSA